MMGVQPIGLRHDPFKAEFNRERRLADGKARAVCHPKQMGVDGNGRLMEGDIEHDIGGLAANAWQCLKLRAGLRHFAPMPLDQQLRQADDVFGLGLVEPDGLDGLSELFLAQCHHLFRAVSMGKQRTGCPVDADIGCLRRENHSHQQGVGVHRKQLALGFGISLGKGGKDRFDLGGRQGVPLLAFGRGFGGSIIGKCAGAGLLRGFGKGHVRVIEKAMPPEQPVFCATDDPQLFAVRLVPFRSLPLKGFFILLGVVMVINVIGALRFIAIGAWPVLPFLGLDVLALFIAFRVSYRSARAYEEIVITPYHVSVRQVDAKGKTKQWRFDALFTKLIVERDSEDEITGLSLHSRGRQLAIALNMPLPEREGLASALQTALRQAKG